jgi:hypothetical protein
LCAYLRVSMYKPVHITRIWHSAKACRNMYVYAFVRKFPWHRAWVVAYIRAHIHKYKLECIKCHKWHITRKCTSMHAHLLTVTVHAPHVGGERALLMMIHLDNIKHTTTYTHSYVYLQQILLVWMCTKDITAFDGIDDTQIRMRACVNMHRFAPLVVDEEGMLLQLDEIIRYNKVVLFTKSYCRCITHEHVLTHTVVCAYKDIHRCMRVYIYIYIWTCTLNDMHIFETIKWGFHKEIVKVCCICLCKRVRVCICLYCVMHHYNCFLCQNHLLHIHHVCRYAGIHYDNAVFVLLQRWLSASREWKYLRTRIKC